MFGRMVAIALVVSFGLGSFVPHLSSMGVVSRGSPKPAICVYILLRPPGIQFATEGIMSSEISIVLSVVSNVVLDV